VGLVKLKVNQMTYEPVHSEQARSVRVKEKYLLDLLAIIVTTLQEVRIDAYFILFTSQVPTF